MLVCVVKIVDVVVDVVTNVVVNVAADVVVAVKLPKVFVSVAVVDKPVELSVDELVKVVEELEDELVGVVVVGGAVVPVLLASELLVELELELVELGLAVVCGSLVV